LLSKNEKETAPISVRLTNEERLLLVRRAGDVGLSAYVREQLFGKGQRSRAPRKPQATTRDLAQVLALLGTSEISSSLEELAHAVSIGALPVMPETEKAITDACSAVEEMRACLLLALGLKGGSE